MENLLSEFSTGLFIWQLVLFIVLVVVLKKVAWGPILNAVNEREEGIRQALDSAEKAKREMAALKADNEALLKEARAERDAMLKEARDTRDKLLSDSRNKAKEEADTLIQNAKNAIETEKKAAMAELKSQVAELSIIVAEKVLKDTLASDDKQQALINKYVDELNLN